MTEIVSTNPSRLIEAYRSYSHAISAEVLKKMPTSVDRDDVIGAAELGLVEAARNFDPSRGVLFKTFAYYRIRGAIYDALRKMGWLKGDSKLRSESGANEYLRDYTETSTNEASTPAEAYQELEQLTSAVVVSYLISADALNLDVPDANHVAIDNLLAEREENEQLRSAIARLPDNNRRLIEEYYFQNATLEEIGTRLGLSKSWVCRLHAKTLDLLRDQLRDSQNPNPGKTFRPLATSTPRSR
jgi:RNA polymerase sigma factor FliA